MNRSVAFDGGESSPNQLRRKPSHPKFLVPGILKTRAQNLERKLAETKLNQCE